MRRHASRRTPTQLRVLEVFWWYYSHKAGRPTRPTLRELANEVRPGMSAPGVLSHILALYARGDIQARGRNCWRVYELTPQGRKRAKLRAEVMERRRKRLAKARKARELNKTKTWRVSALPA